MWEVMPVATVVLIEQSMCQSLAALSSPCWAHITFLPLAKRKIISKIFILDGLRGREPSIPWGQQGGGCFPRSVQAPAHRGFLDEAYDTLETSRVQVTGPLKKGTFCPATPWLQHPQAEQRGSSWNPGPVLTLHVLPVLTLAAAPAGFWVIENIPAGRA